MSTSALQLQQAVIDGNPSGVSSARTSDGSALSLLFDELVVRSGPDDHDPLPQVRRLEGRVRCTGRGWLIVQVRGSGLSSDPQGYAHAMVWANGRRLNAAPAAAGEPFVAAATVPVDGQELRLSLLLLAQRDLGQPNAAAECWVDSIDLQVLQLPAGRLA